jgi:hypothetical protein
MPFENVILSLIPIFFAATCVSPHLMASIISMTWGGAFFQPIDVNFQILLPNYIGT